jgi:two-component system, cell cycle response regulator
MSPDQDDKTPSTPTTESPDEPRIPHLVVLSGPDVGSVYRLTDSESIIGREKAVDLCLSQESVSRRHARVTIEDDQVFIEDLDSTNGTFVGIDRVKGRTLVPDGADIGLGIFTLLRLTYSTVTTKALSRLPAGTGALASAAKVNTRSYLLDVLQSEHSYARRRQTPLTIVFVRADAVSSVERPDTTLVDDVMGAVGTEIDAAIRTEDFLARSDRDHFVILLRSDGDAAERVAERVRSRIAARAALPGSTLAFHTITAVVLPLETATLVLALTDQREAITAEDILSAAQALAEPAMSVASNTVVRLQLPSRGPRS